MHAYPNVVVSYERIPTSETERLNDSQGWLYPTVIASRGQMAEHDLNINFVALASHPEVASRWW